ncbi:hypothetical protein ABC502_14355 [Alkalimonas sp. NCh-2]|uniref:hypothetical protein n=1 Tax=Alkalimonas sp. NCh-2 TaxID=3144846 RepID=UPI0031F6EA9D
MCNGPMVCHGDITKSGASHTKEQLAKVIKNSDLATFYITKDGKYAIHSDFIDVNNLSALNINTVPKIKLK